MTPKQTDSELREEMSFGYDQGSPDGDKSRIVAYHPDGTLEIFIPESELHQREQQIYAELMEKIEKEQSKNTEILDNSFWINQGIASVKTIINNIFKHE